MNELRGRRARWRTAAGWLGAFAGYFCFWIATRWPAIRANTLFFDDFSMGRVPPADFYVGSYRPILLVEYQILELLHPGHFFTVIPKIAAAAYLAAAAAALAALLLAWGVRRAVAFAAPVAALANPVLNDAGLWQVMHGVSLALFLIILGAVVWDSARARSLAVGMALILAGVFGYQIFISLAIFLTLAEPVVKSVTRTPWRLRTTLLRLALLGFGAALQVASMQYIRSHRSAFDDRGLVTAAPGAAFLRERLHGVVDLGVNGVMPVIAWYTGAQRAMTLWKWVPLAIAVAAFAFLFRRRGPHAIVIATAAALLPAAALLVPGVPTVIMSLSPYAWRVASPTAFALAVALVPVLVGMRSRAAAVLVVAACSAVMVPVAFSESSMRVEGYERELATMRGIADHWAARGVEPAGVTIVYDGRAPREDIRLIGDRDLTWGYERRTPRMWSSFTTAWFARYRVLHDGFRFAGCPAPGALCELGATTCDRNCSDDERIYPRVVYDDARHVTFICPGVIAGPPPRRCQ